MVYINIICNQIFLKVTNCVVKLIKFSWEYSKLNKLEILNPLLTIKRGYTITRSNDKVITSINSVNINDKLDIELTDGIIHTVIKEKENK